MIDDVLQKKIDRGRQYRSMVLMTKAEENNEAPDEGAFLVRGYATTYNQPYLLYSDEELDIYEQVDSNAFSGCDMSDVIMQYDHFGRVFARLSNNTLSLQSDEHGLLIEADLGGTAEGRNLYEEIKGGYTNQMSFGFTVTEDRTDRMEGEKRTYLRTITRIGKLYDVSAVSIPANYFTEISARNYCDGVVAEVTEEIRKAEERERQRKILELKLLMEE